MLGKNTKLNRRNAIKKIAMGTTAITIPKIQNTNYLKKSKSLKGNIKQSVCQWCYSDVPLKKLAEESKKIGLVGIDLIGKELEEIFSGEISKAERKNRSTEGVDSDTPDLGGEDGST